MSQHSWRSVANFESSQYSDRAATNRGAFRGIKINRRSQFWYPCFHEQSWSQNRHANHYNQHHAANGVAVRSAVAGRRETDSVFRQNLCRVQTRCWVSQRHPWCRRAANDVHFFKPGWFARVGRLERVGLALNSHWLCLSWLRSWRPQQRLSRQCNHRTRDKVQRSERLRELPRCGNFQYSQQ